MISEAPKCTKCGLCKKSCPIFRVTLSETNSPRGKALLIKNDLLTDTIFKCTLCGNCELSCPLNIKFNFNLIRSQIVSSGEETSANKKMIENVRKYGNPFGKPDDSNDSDSSTNSKELYCC